MLLAPRFLQWAFLIGFGLIACIKLMFAYHGYPLFASDAICFTEPALSLHKGWGLRSEAYSAYGTNVDGKMLFYVPLYPLVASWLMFGQHPNAIFLSLGFLNITSLGLLTFWLYRVLKQKPDGFRGNRWLLLLLLLPAYSTILDTTLARPEILSRLLITAALVVWWARPRFTWAYLGILTALTGLTGPLSGVYMLILLPIALFYEGKIWPKVGQLALGGGLVALWFAVWYPYELRELAWGLNRHSFLFFNRGKVDAWVAFRDYHLLSTAYSFYFFTFLAFLIAVFYWLRRGFSLAAFPRLWVTAVLGLVITMTYCGFFFQFSVYQLYVLAPLMWAATCLAAWQTDRIWPTWALAAVMLLNSSGFAHRTLVFFAALDKGVGLVEAQNWLREKKYLDNNKIDLTEGLFVLPDSLAHYRTLNSWNKDPFDYLLLQQNSSRQLTPLPVPNYELVDHNFKPDRLYLGGIKLSNTIPGYQFAIYRRIKPAH